MLEIRQKNFLLFFFLSVSVFLTNFFLFGIDKATIADDISAALLSRHPNVAINYNNITKKIIYPETSFIENKKDLHGFFRNSVPPVYSYYYGNDFYPILVQERQSGFPLYLIKICSYLTGPYCAVILYKVSIASLNIFLFGFIFYRLGLDTVGHLSMLLTSMDIFHLILTVCPFTCQIFLICLIFFIILLLIMKTPFSVFLSGLLLAFAFYISFETLWFLPLFIVLFSKNKGYFFHRTFYLLFFTSFFFGLIPVVFIHNYKMLFHEGIHYLRPASSELFNSSTLGKTLYYIISGNAEPLFQLYSGDISNSLNSIYSKLFYGIICLIYLIPLISLLFFKNKPNLFHTFIYKKLYLSFILFFFTIWATTLGKNKEFFRYCLFLRPLVISILALSFCDLFYYLEQSLKQNIPLGYKSFFLIPFLTLFFYFGKKITQVPFPSDLKLIQKSIEILEEKKIYSPLIFNQNYGLYSFFSKEKIIPINFDQILGKNQNFRTLIDVLNYIKKGSVIIDMDLCYNSFFRQEPRNFDFETFKTEARKNNFEIFDTLIFKRIKNSKGFLFFEFKKEFVDPASG